MSAYSDAVLNDAPHAYWRLGEAAGTTIFDETANNLDGTLTGTYTLGEPSLLPSETDTSIKFAGGAQGALITDAQTITAISLECWMTPDTDLDISRGRGMLVGASTVGSNGMHGLFIKGRGDPVYLTDHIVVFRVRTGGNEDVVSPGGTVQEGRPHHVVGTAEVGETFKLYIDGCLVAESPSTIDQLADVIEWSVAYPFTGLAFGGLNGWIDEAAVYLYQLTEDQIRNHYTLGTNAEGFSLDEPDDPAVLFHTDFTDGTTDFDSGSATIVDGYCEFGAEEPSSLTIDIPSHPTEFWLRLYMKHVFPEPGGSTTVRRSVLFQDRNGVDQCALAIERRTGFPDGYLHAYGDNSTTFSLDKELYLASNTFQCVEVHVVVHASSGVFEFRVDGLPINPVYTGATSWGGIAELGRLVFTGTAGDYTEVIDNITLRDDGWVGCYGVPCGVCLDVPTVETCVLLETDDVLLIDATYQNVSVTLMDPAPIVGHVYRVKRIDNTSNTVTLDPGSLLIDDLPSLEMLPYDSVSLVTTGYAWYIV